MNYELREKCAVFGVFGKGMDAARLTYFGLFALQHRGQECSGIVSSNRKQLSFHKGSGLVTQVYSEDVLKKLKGDMAIGHNRYATSGGTSPEHIQPVVTKNDSIALAHNGNLPTTTKLARFLSTLGIHIKGSNDSELMHMLIKYYLVKKYTLEDAILESLPLFTGAYSMLVMSKNKLAAIRDPFGIRPLCIGKLNGGYIFASETCALDMVNATYIREVNPGEMVVVDEKGLHSYQFATANQKLDIFEMVYFARPDSMLLGKNVYKVRENLGRELAKEYPIKADVVIPVPDSSIPAAVGYARALGLPCDHALTKNRYIGRTFIMPDQKMRDRSVQMKLNPIKELIAGKRVILVDDSIVRGTTSKKLVMMMRDAGAKEVHVISSSPPVKFPDFYGINTPTQKELIASHRSVTQVKDFIGADSLYYLSLSGLINATELPEDLFCTSCFTGEYPIDIGSNIKKLKGAKVMQVIPTFSHKPRLAVLVSNKGSGTNLQAIIDGIENKKINAKIAVVISDEKDAFGLVRAKKHRIPTEINTEKGSLVKLLKKHTVDYIVLTGWKQFLSSEVLEIFSNQILNLHPGLIPDTIDGVVKNPDGTKGLWNKKKFTNKALQNFLDNRATYAGSTIHFLTKEVDFGPVLGRTFEKIKKDDTVDSLYARLKKKENALYIEALQKLSTL
ncbi:MAG: amidophosphoribosyltransferase [Candidatus Levybacteria bacterium]|nr:amidophosphoribosyltransferase [Candidatus Levybacteria bacterium]